MNSASALVARQAEDEGLWFNAVTLPEAYLQRALRDLHVAVEAQQADVAALREKLVKTITERDAAYAELHKQQPTLKGMFDREVWKAVLVWEDMQ